MSEEKFFELKIGPSEVLLRVHPPDGGKKANLNDIQHELRDLDISFRMEHLFDIYRRSSNQFETLTTRETTKFEILVQVAPEGYEATMTVIPPQLGDDKLTPEKIKVALEHAKVDKGILYGEIKRIMADKVYGEAVVVARGSPGKHGEDGRIEYHLPEAPAGVKVDGENIDYKELNLLKNVDEGAVIASIYPPTDGVEGFDVRGRRHKAKNGKRAKVRLGRNAVMNEDNSKIMAAKSGFVVITGSMVSVEDIYEVPNVDGRTGNIRFSGVVRVKGQVEDNFVIEAGKGIEVFDTVGAATLKSGVDIKIGGGALKANLKAEGSVTAKFINESEVQAGKDVTASQYILHSTVQAGNIVKVKSTPDGFINGGTTRAGDSIWTCNLGSEVSEEITVVEVGTGLHLRRDYERIGAALRSNQSQFDKLCKNLKVIQHNKETSGTLPGDQEEGLNEMVAKALEMRDKLLADAREHANLAKALDSETDIDGYVFVSNKANAGARIQVKRFKMNLNTGLEACAFRLIGGELKVQEFGKAQKAYKVSRGKRASVKE